MCCESECTGGWNSRGPTLSQHLDEVTWTTKNWHGLQMQRLSVVLHTAVAWQTVNELACGESGIVHGAECIAVLNGVA